MADPGLLTIAEASAILRLQPSTMRAWVLRRKIPYVKVGRLVRVRRADIERLIAISTVPACEGARLNGARRDHQTGQERKVNDDAGQDPQLHAQS